MQETVKMKLCLLWTLSLIVIVAGKTLGNPYFDDEEDALQAIDTDYTEDASDNLRRAVQQKQGCIWRGRSCDHYPNDCCYSSSCRCNLWGSNCQCQRMGLFQKWG